MGAPAGRKLAAALGGGALSATACISTDDLPAQAATPMIRATMGSTSSTTGGRPLLAAAARSIRDASMIGWNREASARMARSSFPSKAA
jgi:acetylornithine/succinyldiaminopimelate/putrescine aminotransferase